MKKLFAAEPALLTSAVAGVFAWVFSFLVLHGVVTKTVASATVQEVLPPTVLILTVAIGVFVRQFVIPAVNAGEAVVERVVEKYDPAFSPATYKGFTTLNDGLASISYPQTVATTGMPRPGSGGSPVAEKSASGGPSDPPPILTSQILTVPAESGV